MMLLHERDGTGNRARDYTGRDAHGHVARMVRQTQPTGSRTRSAHEA